MNYYFPGFPILICKCINPSCSAMLFQGNSCWQLCFGSNKMVLTSTLWKRIAVEKTVAFLLVEWRLNLMWIPSPLKLWQTPSACSFSLEICLHLCVPLHLPKHTIHHLFPLHTHFLFAESLNTADLLSFGCSYVIVLPCSYIPLIHPLPYSFHHLHWRPCITT